MPLSQQHKELDRTVKLKTLALVMLLVVILSVFLIGSAYVSVMELHKTGRLQMEQVGFEARQHELKSEVQIALGLIESIYAEAQRTNGDMQKARQRAIVQLRSIRFFENRSGYFMVHALHDSRATAILVPVKTDLEGTDVTYLTDSNGKSFVQEFIRAARSGGGFVTYDFPKVAGGPPLPKLTYIGYFKPWNWEVGAGVYTDDLAAAMSEFSKARVRTVQRNFIKLFGISLVALLLIMAILWGILGKAIQLIFDRLHTTITGLQAAEQNLKDANQSLHDILECVPDAMLVVDMSGKITAWNKAMEDMTGVSAEAITGKLPQEFTEQVFGAKRPLIVSMLDASDDEIAHYPGSFRRMGNRITGEVYFPQFRGKEHQYVMAIAAPLFDSKGQRSGAIQIVRDITEQKEAEKALRESAEFRKRVFEASLMPIVIMEADSLKFIDCNPAAVTIFGFSTKEETLGKTPLDVSASAQYDGTASEQLTLAKIEEAARHGTAVFEWLHQRPNGEQWDAEVHLMSFTAGNRKLLQFTLQDITERKKTAALMMQTEKMLMVGGLAAGMAHEINNPLGIIGQSIQVLERRLNLQLPVNYEMAARVGLPQESFKQYLENRQIGAFITTIRKAVTRASRIIDSTLKFSRKSESMVEYIDLATIVEQTLELAANDYDLKKKYDFKSVELLREFAPDVPKLPMTTVEIQQVLLNLLRNAAQAMHDAHIAAPRIVVRTRAEAAFAVIEVEDNGPGIPPDLQKRIFEPFFTTKSPGSGTGLGLSVSYAIIVNNHHGRLEVYSQPSVGCCFVVKLPLIRKAVTTL